MKGIKTELNQNERYHERKVSRTQGIKNEPISAVYEQADNVVVGPTVPGANGAAGALRCVHHPHPFLSFEHLEPS